MTVLIGDLGLHSANGYTEHRYVYLTGQANRSRTDATVKSSKRAFSAGTYPRKRSTIRRLTVSAASATLATSGIHTRGE